MPESRWEDDYDDRPRRRRDEDERDDRPGRSWRDEDERGRDDRRRSRKGGGFPWWILAIIIPVLLLLLLVCAGVVGLIIYYSGTARFGKELKFGNVQLFYTSAVTKDEAEKVGKYLNEQKIFAEPVSVQLNKTGGTYEVRICVKKGIEQEREKDFFWMLLAADISQKLFNGAAVEIHLCDERLETLRVIRR
jgi:hypothetical protein